MFYGNLGSVARSGKTVSEKMSSMTVNRVTLMCTKPHDTQSFPHRQIPDLKPREYSALDLETSVPE